MDRYNRPLAIDNSKNIPYYTTQLTTKIPTEDIPFYYVVQEGDRLDSISNRFYKTPENWWVIAKANFLTNGSLAVQPGTRLFIPNI
jgi:nucleoid-associated protein YgaU